MLADRRALSRRPAPQSVARRQAAAGPLRSRSRARGDDPRGARQRPSGDMWKWRELLPMPEGVEPVIARRAGDADPRACREPRRGHGATDLLVKDEGRLPTGSFKARGMAVAVTMAKHFGVERIAIPTNGNAGAALAAYARPRRHRQPRHLPGRNARDQRPRNGGLWRRGLGRRRADRRMRRAGRQGRGARACGSTARR